MARRLPRSLLLAGLLACGPKTPLPLDPGQAVEAAPMELEIQWTGVGAFFMQRGEVAILTDPFWSHYPLLRAAFGHIPPDPERIDPWLPPLGNVHAVLVGHGHYDHVSDLPYVAPMLHEQAVVLASQTVAHTFAPVNLPRPITPVGTLVGNAERAGTWVDIADGRARVMALESGHPNQWLFFHLWKRRLDAPRRRAPTKAAHFQEGETYAFLVDFFEEAGSISHRVYIQTSSTGLPAGAVPPGVLDEHPVDVALLPMDVANYMAEGRTTVQDQLQAPLVVFCHWENFFRSRDKSPREIVKVDLRRLREIIVDTEEVRYVFPAWGSRYVIPAP